MKKKQFDCKFCGDPLELITEKEPYRKDAQIKIIVCSRNKCLFQYKDKTDELTKKYFIDNGGRVDDGS